MAERALRSLTNVGNAGKYSPASTLWTYLALIPTFSAKASCVSPLKSRKRVMFFPNFDRTGQGDGFREGTLSSSSPQKELNTRLYLVLRRRYCSHVFRMKKMVLIIVGVAVVRQKSFRVDHPLHFL
ncbi:MAG: hypothetical protein WCK55_21240 [Verrucomicrobiota bacterium]